MCVLGLTSCFVPFNSAILNCIKLYTLLKQPEIAQWTSSDLKEPHAVLKGSIVSYFIKIAVLSPATCCSLYIKVPAIRV